MLYWSVIFMGMVCSSPTSTLCHVHAHRWSGSQDYGSLSVVQADDDVISEVFHSHNLQPPAELRGVSGEVCTGQKATDTH